jgi:hypothetical protein
MIKLTMATPTAAAVQAFIRNYGGDPHKWSLEAWIFAHDTGIVPAKSQKEESEGSKILVQVDSVIMNTETGQPWKVMDLKILLAEAIDRRFKPIEIPKGTLMFHSNHFFGADIQDIERVGEPMRMTDLRRYGMGQKKLLPRLFMNFAESGCLYVVANLTVGVTAYITTRDLKFLNLPVYSDSRRRGSLKDILQLTETIGLRRFCFQKDYAGIITITVVDGVPEYTGMLDRSLGTQLTQRGYNFPEIIMVDHFDGLVKIGHTDILEPQRLTMTQPPIITGPISNPTEFMQKINEKIIPLGTDTNAVGSFRTNVSNLGKNTSRVLTPMIYRTFKGQYDIGSIPLSYSAVTKEMSFFTAYVTLNQDAYSKLMDTLTNLNAYLYRKATFSQEKIAELSWYPEAMLKYYKFAPAVGAGKRVGNVHSNTYRVRKFKKNRTLRNSKETTSSSRVHLLS